MDFRRALSSLKASTDDRYGWWLVATGVVILALAGDTLIKNFTAMLHSGPLVDSMNGLDYLRPPAWEALFSCLSPASRWTGLGRAG